MFGRKQREKRKDHIGQHLMLKLLSNDIKIQALYEMDKFYQIFKDR